MTCQLDIFSLELQPEEPIAPLPLTPNITPPAPNINALAWQQAKADFYLRLISRFMSGTKCSRAVRTLEITRLHTLRQQALQEIER